MKKTAKAGPDGKGNDVASRRQDIQELLRVFLGRESNEAFGFALGLCRDREEAGDLVQEACYRMLKAGRRYDRSKSIKNWFLTILRNAFLDSRRRAERRLGSPLECWDEERGERRPRDIADRREPSAIERLERAQTARRVRSGLRRLPTIYREVVLLCDVERMTYEKAAQVLGIPLGTVRSRLFRARRTLRRDKRLAELR